METVSINIYSLEELNQNSKDHAYSEWLEGDPYSWGEENKDSLKVFEDIFPVKVKQWEYGYHNYINWSFTADSEIENLFGIRLMKYIYNNYFHNIFKGKYYSLWSKTEKNPKNQNMGKLKKRYSKVMFENSCVLTGYCIDNDILDPIYKFLKNPDKNITFYDLMDDCLNSWINACDRDYSASISYERFEEECKDQEWLFYENGNRYY
jgi:hypothetical protein